MKRILFVLFCLLPGLTTAETFPALYDVTGVAADDVLNVRANSSASAAKVGELAHNAQNIEVVRVRNGWGLVNVGETAGWTSMRFLARQEEGDYALARALSCFGTEPYWSLKILQGSEARFYDPDGSTGYHAGLLQVSKNRTDRFAFAAQSLLAVIGRATCSDGMSDRQYGLTIDLWPDATNSMEFYSGCCTMADF